MGFRKEISLLLITLTTWCYAQDLSVTSGGSITITIGTVFFVNGLGLTPSSNFTINGPNAISRSSTALDPQSINRVFTSDNIMSNFQGDITFFYEDSELNGVTETDLVLQVKDGLDVWNAYTGTLDTSANTITYTFGTSTDFSSVTASASSVTLQIPDLNTFDIKLYPNPTISKVYINVQSDIEVKVYNMIGQKILVTQEKSIDLSRLKSGTYIFKVKDLSTNNIESFQILKY